MKAAPWLAALVCLLSIPPALAEEKDDRQNAMNVVNTFQAARAAGYNKPCPNALVAIDLVQKGIFVKSGGTTLTFRIEPLKSWEEERALRYIVFNPDPPGTISYKPVRDVPAPTPPLRVGY